MKVLRPIGYGYINLTHSGNSKDCEHEKLHHSVFLQGEWKPDGADTMFTGQVIACIECNPVTDRGYLSHQNEDCMCTERVIKTMTFKLNFQDFVDVEHLEKHHEAADENENDFECSCEFHIPFREADAIVFNS